jgi:peptidoglycan/LPS O-acetylase OafA/YrhL
MIQRIQTLFLFLISITSGLGLFLLPPIDFLDLVLPMPIVLKSYLISTAVLAFLTLLLFKSRKKQLIINRLHFFIQILVVAGLTYGMVNADDLDKYFLWLVMPLLAMILLILSSRFINKDEDLIRSIDRLR